MTDERREEGVTFESCSVLPALGQRFRFGTALGLSEREKTSLLDGIEFVARLDSGQSGMTLDGDEVAYLAEIVRAYRSATTPEPPVEA